MGGSADERSDGRARMAVRAVARAVARSAGVVGELLMTLGLVLALLAGYSLWWTNVVADRQSVQAADRLRHSWAAPATTGEHAPPTPSAGPTTPAAASDEPEARQYGAGDGVGFLHVPAMGRDYQVLIRMGTDTDVLNEGVAGVYEEPYRSAMPWDETGNFALAAHRDGHGAKFHDLDQVGVGDALVVETKDHWYVYKVAGTLPQTSKYDTGIIAPVPEGGPFTGPGRYITLTTCTPVYTSRYRMAVWGSLVRVDDVDARRTLPPELR